MAWALALAQHTRRCCMQLPRILWNTLRYPLFGPHPCCLLPMKLYSLFKNKKPVQNRTSLLRKRVGDKYVTWSQQTEFNVKRQLRSDIDKFGA